MGSSVSFPDCEFEYKNLNINKGVRKAPEPLWPEEEELELILIINQMRKSTQYT